MVDMDRLAQVLCEWEELENNRFRFRTHDKARVVEKRKYLYLDIGSSGAFMVDRSTGDVYCIKGYGVIDRRKHVGNLATVTAEDLYRCRFWRLK